MNRIAVIVALGLCTGSIARGDEATAKQRYAAGESAYNLGQFPKAIELFTQAYEQSPEPAFLFNIAQAYRQAGDCKQALFFYKRFLSLKANDTRKPIKPAVKEEVESRITELDECVKRDIASKPPDSLDSGQGGTTSTSSPPLTLPKPTTTSSKPVAVAGEAHAEEDDDEDHPRSIAGATEHPKIVSVRLTAGAAKLTVGSLDTPVQPMVALVAGYPISLGDRLELELGPAFTFMQLPYGTTSNGNGKASLFAVAADAGLSYTVIPKLAARADLGAGLQVISGLEKAGNPFVADGSAASGALSTFFARVAVSADYAVTPNLVITATPLAFAYSPAPAGFLPSISSLTTLSFLIGVGYRQ